MAVCWLSMWLNDHSYSFTFFLFLILFFLFAVWFGRIQRIAPLHIPRCHVRVLLSGWGDEYGGARRLAPSLQRLQSGFWKLRADSRTRHGTAAGSAPDVIFKAKRGPHHHHCRTRKRFCQSQWSHRCCGGKGIGIGKFSSSVHVM